MKTLLNVFSYLFSFNCFIIKSISMNTSVTITVIFISKTKLLNIYRVLLKNYIRCIFRYFLFPLVQFVTNPRTRYKSLITYFSEKDKVHEGCETFYKSVERHEKCALFWKGVNSLIHLFPGIRRDANNYLECFT